MVSFVRKGLLALSVTIAASAMLGVASAYAAFGGGCNTSYDGVLQACISETPDYFIVPDAYVWPGHFGCYLSIQLYADGAPLGPPWETFFDDPYPNFGHFTGNFVAAGSGHSYFQVSTLSCFDVYDQVQSPTQWA